jgi:DNA-directed RNA polymerase subunit RPC12/RpoP
MPRIVCPGCEKALKVRDDIKAAAVRCPACGGKIPLEPSVTAEIESVEAPREERGPRPSSKGSPAPDDSPPPRKASRRPLGVDDDISEDRPRVRTRTVRVQAEDDDERQDRTRGRKGTRWHSLGTRWHGLLFLVIVFPLGMFLLCIAFLFPSVGGPALAGLGSTAAFFALAMTFVGMYRKGLVNDMGAVPFLLRRAALIYFLFRYPFAYPKLLVCWVGLIFLGIAMGITGGFLADRGDRMKPPPVVVSHVPPAPHVTGDSEIDRVLADLGNANPNACRVAAEKLATMKPDEHQAVVAQKLAGLADARDDATRNAVVQALGTWATPAEMPVLIRSLNHPNVPTRRAALQVIGKFQDPQSLAPVVGCLQDIRTRDLAEKTLKEMGPMAEKGVLPLLNDQDGFLRLSAVKVLKDVGSQASVPALQALANSDDIVLKGPAQEALTAIAARNPN